MGRAGEAGVRELKLLQLGVFRLRLQQNWSVGVRVFPEREELLVGRLGLDLVSRQNERSAQLQVRQCADGIAEHDSSVVDNFLEFPCGFRPLMCRQIGSATDIGRVEVTGTQKIFRTA